MKGKRSYAEVVKNGSNGVLTAANNVPIRQKKNSVFTRISFPRVSAFDSERIVAQEGGLNWDFFNFLSSP